MKDPDRVEHAIDTIRSMPVSDDASTMLHYLYDCENAGKQPNIHDLGWDRERAQLALVELKARGFIGNSQPS